MRLLPSICCAVAMTLLGCSSDDDGDGSSGSGGFKATACSADDRKDVYTAGISKSSGSLSVKILEATPAPPAKGTNEMSLELLDASGNPVDGATVTVKPFMPDHGHGSAVTPVVTPAGGGKYVVSKVYLSMAGLWRITVSVQLPGGSALEEASFQFCLDG